MSHLIGVYFWRYKIWNQNKKFQLLITVEGTQILEFREDAHGIVAEKRVGEDSIHIMLDVKDCWVLGEGDCLLFISLVEIKL